MRKYIVDDWFKALFYGYASLLTILSLLLLLVPEGIYMLTGVDYDPYIMTQIAAGLLLLTVVGRVIKQEARTRIYRFVLTALIGVLLGLGVQSAYSMGAYPQAESRIETAEAVAEPRTLWGSVAPLAVPMVAKWEGKHPCPDNPEMHCSYLDTIPSTPLWTVCYGHTRTAEKGQRFTDEYCQAKLSPELREYWDGWLAAVTKPRDLIPVPVHAAAASLTYNIGIGAARKASMTDAVSRGDFDDACKRMTRYNRSGGRVVRGLVNRRDYEYRVCMTWST